MIKPCRMTLRYPIIITTVKTGLFTDDTLRQGDTLIEAIGATTDEFCAIKAVFSDRSDAYIDREMSRAQKDQCARECYNLWGPIWKTIWRYEWDANKEAMREEREKALAEYRKRAMGR